MKPRNDFSAPPTGDTALEKSHTPMMQQYMGMSFKPLSRLLFC